MLRACLAFGALVCCATDVAAADIGPKVAYSVGRNLYLAEGDGSSIKLLYTAPSRKNVTNVQLKPGGGEAAFEETACCSTAATSLLKFVRYDSSGTATGSSSITVCGRIFGIAYHPSDGTLLYTNVCNGVLQPLKRLNSSTMASTTVALPTSPSKATWLNNGTELLYAANGKIWRVSISNLGSPTGVTDADCVQTIDAGNETNRVLWTDACTGQIKRLDLSTGQSSVLRQGSSAYFSPKDLRYIYISPWSNAGGYLLISNLDGSGTQTRIGSQAKYLSVDWRK